MTELAFLRMIGRLLPRVRFASGLMNRLVKPIYNRKPRGLISTDVFGIKMTLDPKESVDGNLLLCPQLYEYEELDYLSKVLKPDSVFVDVGAHIGFYSLMASKKITNGEIYAIEASPDTYERLKDHCKENGLPVNTIHRGVSDQHEELHLSRSEVNNSGGQSFLKQTKDSYKVSCAPLVEILDEAGVSHIDLMKVDVEGFEYKVLKHFFDHAAPEKHPRHIIIEYLKGDKYPSTGDQRQLLVEYGYHIEKYNGSNLLLKKQ